MLSAILCAAMSSTVVSLPDRAPTGAVFVLPPFLNRLEREGQVHMKDGNRTIVIFADQALAGRKFVNFSFESFDGDRTTISYSALVAEFHFDPMSNRLMLTGRNCLCRRHVSESSLEEMRILEWTQNFEAFWPSKK